MSVFFLPLLSKHTKDQKLLVVYLMSLFSRRSNFIFKSHASTVMSPLSSLREGTDKTRRYIDLPKLAICTLMSASLGLPNLPIKTLSSRAMSTFSLYLFTGITYKRSKAPCDLCHVSSLSMFKYHIQNWHFYGDVPLPLGEGTVENRSIYIFTKAKHVWLHVGSPSLARQV